jgi:hypothetical protein
MGFGRAFPATGARAKRLIPYHIDVFKYHNLWLRNCIYYYWVLSFTREFSEVNACFPERNASLFAWNSGR